MDLGWSELLVIGVVALIVIGPRDLPGLFKTLGKFTAKIRRMARDFQRAMEDAADDAGVKETANDLRKMTSPSKVGLDKLNEAAKSFEEWDPTKPSERAKSIGDETSKLSEERAEQVRKIREYTQKKGEEKLAAEKAAKEAATPKPEADDAS